MIKCHRCSTEDTQQLTSAAGMEFMKSASLVVVIISPTQSNSRQLHPRNDLRDCLHRQARDLTLAFAARRCSRLCFAAEAPVLLCQPEQCGALLLAPRRSQRRHPADSDTFAVSQWFAVWGISPVGDHQKHNEIRLTPAQAAQHREQRDVCQQCGKLKKKTKQNGAVLSFTSHQKAFNVELFVKLSHCQFQWPKSAAVPPINGQRSPQVAGMERPSGGPLRPLLERRCSLAGSCSPSRPSLCLGCKRNVV